MTLASENTCQCSNKNNCADCKCGCSTNCCSNKQQQPNECPFVKAHPNWQKCPFMRNMFMTMQQPTTTVTDTAAQVSPPDHSACDASKCANIPLTQCTSCHKTPGLNHTVTLAMDTLEATDQTEETAL